MTFFRSFANFCNLQADESKLKLPRMSKQKYKKMNDLYSVYGW